ncbi:MAG: hypothetical protein NUW01_10310 [Gemmatimonadaceae bacterium]|nr:hypothetical protein [Gemmatimonadaceae bacterium]
MSWFFKSVSRRRTSTTSSPTISAHPGLTASEYAEIVGLDVVEVRRRLTDLKNHEIAFQSGQRKGKYRLECCWYPMGQVLLL